MVTLIILFYLLVGVYTGMRRGLTLELVYIAGYFITFLVAMFTYEGLAKFLSVYIPYPSYIPGNHLAIFTEAQAMSLGPIHFDKLVAIPSHHDSWVVSGSVSLDMSLAN